VLEKMKGIDFVLKFCWEMPIKETEEKDGYFHLPGE
jgi:hypothetical protein